MNLKQKYREEMNENIVYQIREYYKEIEVIENIHENKELLNKKL
jgi:hypothetical protein